MTRRTVLEWQSLAYGQADHQVPEHAADRLLAVARASPQGGQDGGRILSLGRHALTARQVVGVLAAEGITLEILPKIEVAGGDGTQNHGVIRQRLVHMLGVALDIDVASGAMTELNWQHETILEILIGLFAKKLADEVRKGVPRRYLTHEDDLTSLRGQLNVVRQFTSLISRPDRLACRYDDLSRNILLNQLMKAAVDRLIRVSRSAANQRRLQELAFSYADIGPLPPGPFAWDSLVLDRTNNRWRDLVELARLLLANRFQTTSAGVGRGFSLTFDMSRLFEAYVARQLKRALASTDLTVHAQGGRLHVLEDAEIGEQRFMTKPDILIKRGPKVEMIIDTKWKRVTRRVDDPKQGVSQSDVYQMIAYGQLYRCERLMLLYPHNVDAGEFGLLSRHSVVGTTKELLTASLDLSRDSAMQLTALCDVGSWRVEQVAGAPPRSIR